VKNFEAKTVKLKVGVTQNPRIVNITFMRFFKLFGYEFGWAKLRRDNPPADYVATGDGRIKNGKDAGTNTQRGS
jgi:hypothetical protein